MSNKQVGYSLAAMLARHKISSVDEVLNVVREVQNLIYQPPAQV